MNSISERKASWRNASLTSEGLIYNNSSDTGVLICHPHPLMGGNMDNNVVEVIQRSFAEKGYSTLRFNFRGVGESTGGYDEGRGEQADILSACAFLESSGVKKIILAGYSFGAWVGANLLAKKNNYFSNVYFVSPPDKYFNFDWDVLHNQVHLIVCGDHDDFCDMNEMKKKAQKINAACEIINEADHFYLGKEKELSFLLQKYIS